MNQKAADLLSLLRLHHAPTAVSDTVAAALLARHLLGAGSLPDVLLVISGSVFLYSAGMVLNDVADVRRDRKLHPDRPLPAGRVSTGAAFTVGATLLLAGLVTASFVGIYAVAIGGFIAIGILIYDFEATTSARWGPVLMGLLRSANFLFGLSIAGPTILTWTVGPILALFTGFHIFLITSISLLEESPHASDELTLYAGADVGLIIALVAYLLLVAGEPLHLRTFALAVIPVVIYYLQFGFAVQRALRESTPEQIGRIVGTGVQGLILIESTILAFLIGPVRGLALLVLFVPVYVSRWL